jgi:hypothetical protein
MQLLHCHVGFVPETGSGFSSSAHLGNGSSIPDPSGYFLLESSEGFTCVIAKGPWP